MTTVHDENWPWHVTTNFEGLEDREISSVGVLMERDSYMFLIDMLTDEQKAKMTKMAKKYKYNAYLVRVNRGEKSSAIVES